MLSPDTAIKTTEGKLGEYEIRHPFKFMLFDEFIGLGTLVQVFPPSEEMYTESPFAIYT